MKTIKRQILFPFVVLGVVLPVFIFLFFQISMKLYWRNFYEKELYNTAQTMQLIVKKQLLPFITDMENAQVGDILSTLRSAMLASKMSANTDLLVYSGDRTLIYPKDLSETFADDELVQGIAKEMSGQVDSQVQRYGEYLYIARPLTKAQFDGNPYVVFVAAPKAGWEGSGFVSGLLVCVIICGFAACILAAYFTSRRLSESVKRVGKMAKRIGDGDFTTEEPMQTSKELYDLQNSINEMAERLSAYDKAQKTFLQNASHEIKNPLMSIGGYAEGISSGVLTDTKAAAAVIKAESDRLSVLISQLLTLSRIENYNYSSDFTEIDLCDTIRDAAQRLQGIALQQGKELAVLLPEKCLCHCDEELLFQLLSNLLSNALRYAKSKVILSLMAEGTAKIIQVRDDGQGVSEQDKAFLFDRFYKGDRGNFGLGLSIAKSAADFLGAEIKVRNEGGAVFEVVLP